MSSWSARQAPNPSNLNANGALTSNGSERQVPISLDHNVPVLLPTSTTSTSIRRAHSRSLSNPFPSFLPTSIGHKGNNKKNNRQEYFDSDDDDDEVTYLPEPLSSSPRRRLAPEEEHVAGRCMTCRSTVRWPRSLKVFRCTTCLTVNDLEPCANAADSSDKAVNPPAGESPKAKTREKVNSLSIDRTRHIIDQCISAYFQRKVRSFESTQSTGRRSPPNGHSTHTRSGSITDDFSTSLTQPVAASPLKRKPVPNSDKNDGLFLLQAPPGQRKPNESRGRVRSRSDISQTSLTVDGEAQERNPSSHDTEQKDLPNPPVSIFRSLEMYIIDAFTGCECLNNSFLTARPSYNRAATDEHAAKPYGEHLSPLDSKEASTFELDPKMLLLGDIGENSSWWMGGRPRRQDMKGSQPRDKSPTITNSRVTSRSPRIDWGEVNEWFHLVVSVGESWISRWSTIQANDPTGAARLIDISMLDREIYDSRVHVRRTLLKATENLLKRPRRPLRRSEDIRFLLILLANPLLLSASLSSTMEPSQTGRSNAGTMESRSDPSRNTAHAVDDTKPGKPRGAGRHAGIIKRILGQLSNLSDECHHHLINWFARYSGPQLEKHVELIGSFVTYRLTRQHGRHRSESGNPNNGLVPSFSTSGPSSHAQLYAALNDLSPSKSSKNESTKAMIYDQDWQIQAAARVMSLLFTANNITTSRRRDISLSDQRLPNTGLLSELTPIARGHKVPISTFYNTLLDYSDMVADFEAWEARGSKFSFCQYPFFLSIYAKIRILEHDARRQKEIKAREAFFDSILSHRAISQYLVLRVRRDCLVEDSLRGVSAVVGAAEEEIKKGLRIEFIGEEGVDAGGLRKEWFLLLVREVFDPNHGLFVYDEDSRFCYFNPFCFESSEQFFLVGVLLGLAIYNTTILDVALPPFAFRKLLSSAPQARPSTFANFRPYSCTLDDLAEFRPALAKGLQSLLDFEGDVQETFCYDFVAQVTRYGQRVEVPLCPGGEKRPVTNSNRQEFVSLYVRYLLDTAVSKQFEPFKRGFYTVCAGNALSLFQPEEIEAMVRGSDEPLDVTSLRGVATYENWPNRKAPESEPVVQWFWSFFENASPLDQRKLLSFITGSDRIPAMGATSLTIRLSCLGEDCPRYPIAHTCFNKLGLFRYATRQKLESKLWGAVINSEGFGLK